MSKPLNDIYPYLSAAVSSDLMAIYREAAADLQKINPDYAQMMRQLICIVDDARRMFKKQQKIEATR